MRHPHKLTCWICERQWWTFEALMRCVRRHRDAEQENA